MRALTRAAALLGRRPWLVMTMCVVIVTSAYLLVLWNSARAGVWITFIDDAAADLEWARQSLADGLGLHGHWSNSLGTNHPGPWYLWLLAAAGLIGERSGMGFDTGASAGLAVAGIALAYASAYAIGRTHKSWRVTLAVLASSVLVAATTSWRGTDTGMAPAFGQYAWAGAVIPWAVLAVLAAAWSLTGPWAYRSAFTLVVTGVGAQLYLPLGLAATPLALVAALMALRVGGRRLLVGSAVAGLLAWGPLLLRAVRDGLPAMWPKDAVIDVTGRGVDLSAGMDTLSSNLLGVPAAGALLVAAVTIAGALVVAVRVPRWRLRALLVLVVAVVGTGAQLLLWPNPLNRYQTYWVLCAYAALAFGLAMMFAERRGASLQRLATLASVVVIVVSVLTGALLVEPARLVGARPETTAQLSSLLTAALDDAPGPAGVLVDGKAWNSGQTIVHHARALGMDVCTVDRPDLTPLACRTLPDRLIVVRAAEPGSADLSRTPVGYGASLTIRGASPTDDLPDSRPQTRHPQQLGLDR